MAAAAHDGFHQIPNINISVTFVLILRDKVYGWKGHMPSSFFAACINWRNFVLNLEMNFFKMCKYYSFHNRNEFLAVRNAEGSFYICQAMQNIYRSSPRIRIRWLSQEKKDNKSTDVYIPDFYDATGSDAFKLRIY